MSTQAEITLVVSTSAFPLDRLAFLKHPDEEKEALVSMRAQSVGFLRMAGRPSRGKVLTGIDGNIQRSCCCGHKIFRNLQTSVSFQVAGSLVTCQGFFSHRTWSQISR